MRLSFVLCCANIMFVQHNFLKVKFSDRIDENGTNIHFHSLMSIVVIPLNDVFCYVLGYIGN